MGSPRKQRKSALAQDIEQLMGETLGMINPVFVQRLADHINANYSKRRAPASKPAETDVASKHPAIKAFRAVTNRFPHKSLWDGLVKALGDQPDCILLDGCWKAWLAAGRNPMAVTWATEWYPYAREHNGSMPTYKALVILHNHEQRIERAACSQTIEEVIYGK